MSKEEILEYNKRCAEFLDWKKTYAHEFDKYGYCQTVDGYETPFINIISDEQIIEYNNSRFTYSERELQFHSDWNWIMEVVEAIQKISEVNIYKDECSIAKKVNVSYIKGYGKTKEAVVQAINQFLIWHNEQNNQNTK